MTAPVFAALRRRARVALRWPLLAMARRMGWRRLPRYLVFYVTFRCDARCKACNIWMGDDDAKKAEELSLAQVDELFADRFFRKLEHVNLQGGEPTLRHDLGEIAAVLLRRLPRLRELSVTTNALDPAACVARVRELYDLCRSRRVDLAVCVSIDGVGPVHDDARGAGSFARVTKTLEGLAPLRASPGFRLGTNAVLTARNVDHLPALLDFQHRTFGVEAVTPVEFREHFLNREGTRAARALLFEENPAERDRFVEFLTERGRPRGWFDLEAFRYEQLRRMIAEGKPRTQPCRYMMEGLVLEHTGAARQCCITGEMGSFVGASPSGLYFSKEADALRARMKEKNCASCYPYGITDDELSADLVQYLRFQLAARRRSAPRA